jgi:hypothetical protein
VLVAVRQVVRVAAVLVIPVTITCALVAPRVNGPRVPRHAVVAVTTPVSARPAPVQAADTPQPPDEQGAVDLYGNDVTDAVAKYKLDADGSLYEAHSPQTQLPRLGSPRS